MNTGIPMADASSLITDDHSDDHSVAVSQTKNDHITCYNESKKELFYMKWLIVDRLTRAKFDIFVKCLKLVLVYRIFCENKP